MRFGSIIVWRWHVVFQKIPKNQGEFYGMELPRVGAFTEKWGSGYRNPVQILAWNRKNYGNSGNLGLVYYSGGFWGYLCILCFCVALPRRDTIKVSETLGNLLVGGQTVRALEGVICTIGPERRHWTMTWYRYGKTTTVGCCSVFRGDLGVGVHRDQVGE